MQNSMISVNFLNRNTVKWDFFYECRCRCWWNHQRMHLQRLIGMQIFFEMNAKTKLKSKPKKKPKVKPCQHQLTKDIFVDSCCVFFFSFCLNVDCPMAYFCVIENALCEIVCLICTVMCVIQCVWAWVLSWNSHRWWITMESTQFSNC